MTKTNKNTHGNYGENFRLDTFCPFTALIGLVQFKFRAKYLCCLHSLKH